MNMTHEMKTVINPLQGASNFPSWKIQCKMSLLRDSLWSITNGTEVAPATTEVEKYAKFVCRRDKALATIVLSLNTSLLYLVGTMDDPVAVWKKLQDTFQKKTWANKMRLRRKLLTYKLSVEGSVQNHIRIMTEMFDEFSVIGEAVGNDDRVMYLLSSLPESYDVLVTSLESNETVPDIDSVIEKLLQMENKFQERNPPKAEKAFFVGNEKNKKKCFHCKKSGHLQSNCWILHPEKNTSHKNSSQKVEKAQVSKSQNVLVEEDNVSLVAHQANSALLSNSGDWLVDSGATSHMTNNADYFSELEMLSSPQNVSLGDGHGLCVKGIGTIILTPKLNGNKSKTLILKNTLYVPDIAYNLFSISKATANNVIVTFKLDECIFSRNDGTFIASAVKEGKLYFIKSFECSKHEINTAQSKTLWHRRLGHIGTDRLDQMMKHDIVNDLNCKNSTVDPVLCEPCIVGKTKRLSFPKQTENRSNTVLELVHSDVCGKIETKSLGHAEYFVTFTDDASRYVWVFPMKHKSEVFSIFKEWKVSVETETGMKLKKFRSDNGGEYISNDFKQYLKKEGVSQQFTVPKTPEQMV